MILCYLPFPEESCLRDTVTRGSAANTVMMERLILTAFDSSNQTYKKICAIGRMMPPIRERIPAIHGEEGCRTVDTGYSQCHVTQVSKALHS